LTPRRPPAPTPSTSSTTRSRSPPTRPGYAYVVWDRLNLPSDAENINAFHSFGFRGDTLFARTTNGGATWEPYRVLFAPQANMQTIGHQIVVLPDGTLVDSFTLLKGSGNQPAKAAQNSLAVIRSTDHGLTWSDPIIVGSMQPLAVTDPDTGAAVRTGEILADFAVDPGNGNLYLVWSDARFSNFRHNDIAFSMSTDGGLHWSVPIKVNQAPVNIPDGNQQAFVPSVAVAADHTVAVTYYDFRNNTPAAGVPTDYWLAHADSNLTSPNSWVSDEKRLTDASFDLEKGPATGSGDFLGDYEGLAAAGNSFYALFAQAGSGASDPSNIWFRDPPPETALGSDLPPAAGTTAEDTLLAGPAAPRPAVFSGQGDSAAWSLAGGLFGLSSEPPRRLSTPVGENRLSPTAKGIDAVAVDETVAASVWGETDGPGGLSGSTSEAEDLALDWLTDGWSADAAVPDGGSGD
jgi:hypothetical protein